MGQTNNSHISTVESFGANIENNGNAMPNSTFLASALEPPTTEPPIMEPSAEETMGEERVEQSPAQEPKEEKPEKEKKKRPKVKRPKQIYDSNGRNNRRYFGVRNRADRGR